MLDFFQMKHGKFTVNALVGDIRKEVDLVHKMFLI